MKKNSGRERKKRSGHPRITTSINLGGPTKFFNFSTTTRDNVQNSSEMSRLTKQERKRKIEGERKGKSVVDT